MSRFLTLAYGLLAYVAFLAAFLYAIGFIGGFLVPKDIDTGSGAPLAEALLVDIALLGLFGIQHSVMARQGFKRWWTKIIPCQVERSTFVLLTSIILGLLYWQWRPLAEPVVWEIQEPALRLASWSLFAFGFVVVLLSTFLIDHFDLFGLRQVVLYALGRPYTSPTFRISAFYRYVRHPLMLGFLIAFWATPVMTVGHLFFSIMTTGYICLGI